MPDEVLREEVEDDDENLEEDNENDLASQVITC